MNRTPSVYGILATLLGSAFVIGACSSDDGSTATSATGASGGGGGGAAGGPATPGGSGPAAGAASSPLSATPFDFLNCTEAAPTPQMPPAGGTVVTSASLGSFGGDDVFTATFTDVPVEGQSFTTARRATISGIPENPWNAQMRKSNALAIGTGDVLLADFWARCEKTLEESNECRLEFIIEDTATYEKAIAYPVRVGKDWTHFYVPLVAPQAYDAGGAGLGFFAGFADQSVDLAAFTVSSYGPDFDESTLPETAVSYPGIAADAPWRQTAAERIDQVRRDDLSVAVIDSAGQPVPGASVQVTMKRHAFLWGSALSSGILARGEEPDQLPRYEQEVTRLFNIATLYNAFKWKPWEGDWGGGWDKQRADDALKWIEGRDIPFRGHVLVWPSWRHLPDRLEALETEPATLRQEVLDHIDEAMALTRGRAIQWDVLNEPFDNHDLMDILGDDVVVEWFERAREADPDVELFLNDYAILTGGSGDTGHRDDFEKWIKLLTDAGAPLDGLGMQSHFGRSLTGPEEVYELLDRYGTTYDKDVAITEYDINVEDEHLAGCFTHDFMTAVFSHPKTTTFVMWGFRDDGDPIFDSEWNQQLSGRVFEDLIYKRWWTDETITTGESGAGAVRAFHGTYAVTVTVGDKTVAQEVTHLRSAPASVTIQLP